MGTYCYYYGLLLWYGNYGNTWNLFLCSCYCRIRRCEAKMNLHCWWGNDGNSSLSESDSWLLLSAVQVSPLCETLLMRPHCFGQTSEVEPFWRMLAWQLPVWQLLFSLCAALEDSLAVCCQVWRDCRVSLCSHRVVGDKGCCGGAIRVLMSSEFTW